MTTPALEDYFRAVSLGPFDATNYVSRGIGLAAIEEFGDARSDYNEAIRLSPESGDANRALGDLLLLEGKPELALQEFERAIELYSLDHEAHFKNSKY